MLAIGADHGGLELKNLICGYLETVGVEFIDFGTYTSDSVDYPDYAQKVCEAITNGECDKGILVCTTGIGMSMCANKHKGIRAAQCSDPHSAKMTRLHNDANVLTLGGKIIGFDLAKEIVNAFLENEFMGDRHQRRVDKMMNFEK